MGSINRYISHVHNLKLGTTTVNVFVLKDLKRPINKIKGQQGLHQPISTMAHADQTSKNLSSRMDLSGQSVICTLRDFTKSWIREKRKNLCIVLNLFPNCSVKL